jgi:uncharacterized membrane protein YebE (DUF533 family)
VLDAEDIINGIVRGALSGRRKSWTRTSRAVHGSGLVNAKTLLAAAGVAWGLFETWQGTAGRLQPAGSSAPHRARRPVAPPTPAPSAAPEADEAGVPAPVARLLRIMISAARADGELGPAERERILKEAREVGAEALVQQELEAPRPLGELVAGVSDPELQQQLYTLAFVIVRADET